MTEIKEVFLVGVGEHHLAIPEVRQMIDEISDHSGRIVFGITDPNQGRGILLPGEDNSESNENTLDTEPNNKNGASFATPALHQNGVTDFCPRCKQLFDFIESFRLGLDHGAQSRELDGASPRP